MLGAVDTSDPVTRLNAATEDRHLIGRGLGGGAVGEAQARRVLALLLLSLAGCSGIDSPTEAVDTPTEDDLAGRPVIDSAGGDASLADGKVILSFPSGAVSQPITITAKPATQLPAGGGAHSGHRI